MAKQVTMWQADNGSLHPTAELAHFADAFDRAIRGAPLKALPAALSGLDLSWLEILYSHVHNGNRESAGDLLFERIDDLLCDELFQDADNTIRTIDVGRLDSYALVGLLSVTYAARRELPSRAPMVRRIEARLAVVAPGRVEELMAGLR